MKKSLLLHCTLAAFVVLSASLLKAQTITTAVVGSSTITVTPNPVPGGYTATLIPFSLVNSTCDATGEASPLQMQGTGSVSAAGAQPVNLTLAKSLNAQTICVAEKYTGSPAISDTFSVPMSVTAAANPPSPPASANPPTPTSNVSAGTGTASNTFSIGLTAPASLAMSKAIAASGKITYDESNPAAISSLVDQACATSIEAKDPTLAGRKNDFSTYEVFNVITLTGDAGSQSITSNNWYTFNEHAPWYEGFHGWKLGDFDPSTRFYGAKHIILVSIVANYTSLQGTPLPGIKYGTILTQVTPTNLSDAYQLLGVIFPSSTVGAAQAAQPVTQLISGCTVIPIGAKYSTSSIEVDTTFPATGKSSTATLKFVNEPKSWWDVSFALPVTKASALTYASAGSGTGPGTVTASSISKQNLFAVFDLYLPFADLKKPTAVQMIPHPFFGAAITGRPLDNMLFGVSAGLHLVEVYAGALMIKQQQLNGLTAGSAATPAQLSSATTNGFKPSLSVGIKISIPSVVTLLGKGK